MGTTPCEAQVPSCFHHTWIKYKYFHCRFLKGKLRKGSKVSTDTHIQIYVLFADQRFSCFMWTRNIILLWGRVTTSRIRLSIFTLNSQLKYKVGVRFSKCSVWTRSNTINSKQKLCAATNSTEGSVFLYSFMKSKWRFLRSKLRRGWSTTRNVVACFLCSLIRWDPYFKKWQTLWIDSMGRNGIGSNHVNPVRGAYRTNYEQTLNHHLEEGSR